MDSDLTEAVGIVLPEPIQRHPKYGYLRILGTPTHIIGAYPMGYNIRVVQLRNVEGYEQERFWCYEGNGVLTFIRVIVAVLAWGGELETEPQGWLKSHDGRYGGRLKDDPYLPH